MSKPVVLVTSMQLSEPAQQILRDAGLEIAFVPEPTTEDSSIAALAGAKPAAVLMRGRLHVDAVHTGAANADAVAELALALMLALARELPRLDRGVKGGAWERPHFQGREFRGREARRS